MRADDAHGYLVLHITAVCTWHRAAMVVIVVRLTHKICLQTFARGMNLKENDKNDRAVQLDIWRLWSMHHTRFWLHSILFDFTYIPFSHDDNSDRTVQGIMRADHAHA